MMDSIYGNLKVEMEHAEQFEDRTLPTLDFKMFVQDNKVLYSFYQKPVANKCVIHKDSALGMNMKIASHTQNLIRRMKNTSEDVSMETRMAVINEYNQQLTMSGWGEELRRRIIEAGLVGYENMKRKAAENKTSVHRSAAEGAAERRRKKLTGKSNWFKSAPKQRTREAPKRRPQQQNREVNERKPPVSVLFCPQTPNGTLGKKLKEQEVFLSQLCGEAIKIVERSGSTIRQLLVKSNPWASGTVCGDTDCLLCKTGGGKQDCGKRNICYEIFCKSCRAAVERKEPGAVDSFYPGESARGARERSKNHMAAYRANQKDSFMFKHYCEHHGQGAERPEFGMKVLRYHTSATTRQVHEACVIWQRSRGVKKGEGRILNSKSMFNRCKLQRLVIEDSNEKEEDSIEGIVKDRVEVEMQCRDEGNGENPPILRTDSSTTTSGVTFKNRRTQQTTKITQFYKFRGKRK